MLFTAGKNTKRNYKTKSQKNVFTTSSEVGDYSKQLERKYPTRDYNNFGMLPGPLYLNS